MRAASIGGNVYSAYVQQYGGALNFRDREACYAWEPNGIALGPGYYDSRLVGSYLGLPLFVPTCCPGGSFSSSSASPVQRYKLGTGSSGGVLATGITIPGVTTRAGLVIVNVATVSGDTSSGVQVTYAGLTFSFFTSAVLLGGAALTGAVYAFYAVVPATSGTIEVTSLGGLTTLLASAVNVVGLTNNADRFASNANLGAAPDSGATSQTAFASEYAQGASLMLAPAGAWSWANSFLSGGQDVSETVSGTAAWLVEGGRTLTYTDTVDAALTGTVAGAAATLATTYS